MSMSLMMLYFAAQPHADNDLMLLTTLLFFLGSFFGLLAIPFGVATREHTAAAVGTVVVVITVVLMLAPWWLHGSTTPIKEIREVSVLRSISTAQVTYLSYSRGSYGTLEQLIAAGLLDAEWVKSAKGYEFNIPAHGADFLATAMPRSNRSDRYGYYVTTDGLVRYATTTTDTCKPCYPAKQAGQPVP